MSKKLPFELKIESVLDKNINLKEISEKLGVFKFSLKGEFEFEIINKILEIINKI